MFSALLLFRNPKTIEAVKCSVSRPRTRSLGYYLCLLFGTYAIIADHHLIPSIIAVAFSGVSWRRQRRLIDDYRRWKPDDLNAHLDKYLDIVYLPSLLKTRKTTFASFALYTYSLFINLETRSTIFNIDLSRYHRCEVMTDEGNFESGPVATCKTFRLEIKPLEI